LPDAIVIGDEPTNPAHVLAAMAFRESGCVIVTEVFKLDHPVPHYQFHVHTHPPSGGSMGWTLTALAGEVHAHPRHPEVALSFAELPNDHPQREAVRENRDSIVECFQAVM
jgi:hypothetical protein